MYIVVSYDVVNDRKRTKLAKELLNFGRRVQKSVFECRLEEARYFEMKKVVDKIIDLKEDSVRYYNLCQRCLNGIDISGWGTVTEDEETIVV